MDSEEDVGPGYPPVDGNERLFRLLNTVLSSEGELKQAAEQAIKNVELADDYPTQLTEVLLNPNWQTDVRLLASDKLREFVRVHWCARDKYFIPPEIIPGNKARIKKLLLTGLIQTTIEMRRAVAGIMSFIVRWDWPDNWPELIDTIVGYLNGENEFGVKGALSFLARFRVGKVDNYQNMDSIACLLREMNKIFAGENLYSEEIRCLTCRAFQMVVYGIAQEKQPEMIRRYLQPAVLWFGATSMRLWISENCSSQLKIDILDALTAWMEDIPKSIIDFIADMVPLARETMIDCAKDYQAYVVNRGDGQEEENESIATRMGNFSGGLVKVIFRFLEKLMNLGDEYSSSIPYRNRLDSEWVYLQDYFLTPHALGHVIMLMQVTDEKIKQWQTDFDDFVEEEGDEEADDYFNRGIRRAAIELIQEIRHQNRGIASIFLVVIMKYLQGHGKQNDAPFSVSQNSWKSHEAFLLAFSLMKSCITSKKNGILPRYDAVPILENIVLADLNDSASHALLVGRCLSVGGIYSGEMPSEIASPFLKATVKGLNKNQPACVRICAAKAVRQWYDPDNSGKFQNQNMLSAHISAVFEALYSVAKDLKSNRVHALVLESIASLMAFDEAFTVSVASEIYTLVETALVEYDVMDSISAWLTISKKLLRHPECNPLIQTGLTKTLLSMMTNTPEVETSKGCVAIYIMLDLVKHSDLPKSNFLIDPLFPAACNYVVSTNYAWGISDSGIKLIREFLPSAAQRMVQYEAEDTNGRYGAEYILQVIVHALNHKSATTMIGELCEILILLIEKAWNQMRQDIHELLKTLLRHMRQQESTLVTRKLLMVYAHLIHRGSDTIFNYVTSLSVVKQKNFLESIIAEGFCKEYRSVDGKKQETIKLALVKVLEHGLMNLSSPLHQITWKGSTQPIPLLVKICQMTINDQSSTEPTTDQQMM